MNNLTLEPWSSLLGGHVVTIDASVNVQLN